MLSDHIHIQQFKDAADTSGPCQCSWRKVEGRGPIMGPRIIAKNNQVLRPVCVGLLVGGLSSMCEALVHVNWVLDHV